MSQNNLLAKNTMYLSLRMLVVLVINLYCSRIILNKLGFVDYGIYNVVGSVVIFLSFLQNALSGASSRFIIFEIGKENDSNLTEVFNTTLFIHLGITCFLILSAIIFSFFYFDTYLTIPSERLATAKIVFILSVATAIINVVYIPFESLFFAYEKFKIYAIGSIFESVSKLIAALMLTFSIFSDKLLWYGIFLFGAILINKTVLTIYAKRNLARDIKIGFLQSKSFLRPIFLFFGWDIYGNFSLVIKDQGINLLLNLFFGPLLNAANGIAQQVQAAIGAFSNSFLMAVKPQIIKSYALNDLESMSVLVYKASKFSFFILLLISLPLFFEIEFVLKVWLINVPAFTVEFCRYILLINLINGTLQSVNYSIHATGKIKHLSFLSGTIFLLTAPIVYLGFKYGFSPVFSYIVVLVSTLLATLFNLKILQHYIAYFSVGGFFKNVAMKCLLVGFISAGIIYGVRDFYFRDEGWLRFFQTVIISLLTSLGSIYLVGMDLGERVLLKNFVKKIKK